ncbi:adenylate/guanylate cyclase domain-containing protein [Oleomonas cavernae]|uniref:Adenylate/guanylate cyclase domain-containing protein n=1 Tax=Oleomonas cavernae TaxID=2320859 RepID=A0A418WHN8_9PROT|nr:adenylate/guanylate cyclase domain-containing protein [Oleomonas cavernae]RJF89543.1 adenylate/guanylate cyclase domain-containing protein [Oleomonas cavernae]
MSQPARATTIPQDEIWDETLTAAAQIAARGPLPSLPAGTAEGPVAAFLMAAATARLDPPNLIGEFANTLFRAGLPIFKVTSGILMLHPQIYARTFVWDRETGVEVISRGFEVQTSDFYLRSPVRLIHLGAHGFRRRLEHHSGPYDFPVLEDLAAEGATDYLIRPLDFATTRRSFISFATDRPGGFTDDDLARLDSAVPLVAMRFEITAQRALLDSLLSLYLGRDAARRVVTGSVRRGEGSTIRAAIMTCDMRGFTRLSDRAKPGEVIALLDTYFDVVTLAVHAHGGEVLKFMGDGCLAIFPADEGTGTGGEAGDACRRALAAAQAALAGVAAIEELPTALGPAGLKVGFALNFGDVVYGNIGSSERLDFTVIGAAVNEVARVEALTKVLERPLLATQAFARTLGDEGNLRSLGQHVLRGRREPTEIFTVDDGS